MGFNYVSIPVPSAQRQTFQSVAQRAPTAVDDAQSGYAVGDFWATTKNIWQCLSATAGNACWLPYPAGLLPPQAAVGGAAPLFMGGVRRMNPAYTGPLIRVGRTGDATELDIAQNQDWGLDFRSMEAFANGGTLLLAKVYNQDSSGFDLAQATAANRPSLSRRAQMGNGYSYIFDSTRNGTLVSKSLALSASIAGTTVAVSAFSFCKAFNAISGSNVLSLTGTAGARSMTVGYSAALNQWRTTVTGTGLTPLAGKPSNTGQIVGFVSSGTDHTLFVDNQTLPRGSTLGSTAWNGGFQAFAADDTAGNGYMEACCMVVYGRALSALERGNLFASLYWNFGTCPQARDTITFYGDSITESYGGSLGQTLGRQSNEALVDRPHKGFEVGAFGQTAEALMVQSTMNSYLTPIANAQAKNNVLQVLCGTNSINANTLGATVFASLKQIVAQARTMGFGKISVGTTLPRTSFTGPQEIERQSLNTLLRAQWPTFADGLLDYAGDSIMGTPSSAADTSLFIDGIHPTDKGYSIMAQMPTIFSNNAWKT